MIIKGFAHFYLVNHWYTIVTDQLRILLTSGLYDASESVTLGVVGSPAEVFRLTHMIVELYPKLKIGYQSQHAQDFEFPTLKLIEADNSPYAGYYFHTKAVTKPADTVANHWRAWLNEAVLNQWRGHYDNIVNGYDVSSVNHCRPPQHPEHFSGNFWWFNRLYINKLPHVDSLRHTYRFDAEQWICRGHGRFYDVQFKEPGRDVFTIQYDPARIQ